MQATAALIKREFLEHRLAFLYVPVILLVVSGIALVLAVFTGNLQFQLTKGTMPSAAAMFQISIGFAFLLWSAYLLLGLFFYYADSFAADRRDNAFLFWKSMPQSDLKILACKALSGISIFLALTFLYALVTGLLIYLALLLASAQSHDLTAAGPIDAVLSFLQMGAVGAFYLVLSVLWYAPGLAWVAAISTVVRRWSIPLAFLIPLLAIGLEHLFNPSGDHTITNFLFWRFQSFIGHIDATTLLLDQDTGQPIALIGLFFSSINWLHMVSGLLFAALMIYIASEYRRRRIDA